LKYLYDYYREAEQHEVEQDNKVTENISTTKKMDTQEVEKVEKDPVRPNDLSKIQEREELENSNENPRDMDNNESRKNKIVYATREASLSNSFDKNRISSEISSSQIGLQKSSGVTKAKKEEDPNKRSKRNFVPVVTSDVIEEKKIKVKGLRYPKSLL